MSRARGGAAALVAVAGVVASMASTARGRADRPAHGFGGARRHRLGARRPRARARHRRAHARPGAREVVPGRHRRRRDDRCSSASSASSSTASPRAACSAMRWRRRCARCASSGCSRTRDESALRRRAAQGRRSTREFLQAGFVNLGDWASGPTSSSRAAGHDDGRAAQHAHLVWDLDEVFGARWRHGRCRGAAAARQARSRLRGGHVRRLSRGADGGAGVSVVGGRRATTPICAQSFLRGCIIISSRAFDQLPSRAQRAVREATAQTHRAPRGDRARSRTRRCSAGCSPSRGSRRVPVSEAVPRRVLRRRRGRRASGCAISSCRAALLQRVLALLADYRAVHRPITQYS